VEEVVSQLFDCSYKFSEITVKKKEGGKGRKKQNFVGEESIFLNCE
jgi:hypothetical protein